MYNLGRLGAAKAIKSDFAKQKIKGIANKYLDQAFDSVTSDLSRKLDPIHGKEVDIHKWIGKLPRPQSGFTLLGHNFTGPYNPLDQQVKFNPETGEILEIYQQSTGKTDAVAS